MNTKLIRELLEDHENQVSITTWEHLRYPPEGEWVPLTPESTFRGIIKHVLDGYEGYRRRPRTIRIGEFDVPEPERTGLANGTEYFLPIPTDACSMWQPRTWTNGFYDYLALNRGLVHRSEKAAYRHAIALISLSKA